MMGRSLKKRGFCGAVGAIAGGACLTANVWITPAFGNLDLVKQGEQDGDGVRQIGGPPDLRNKKKNLLKRKGEIIGKAAGAGATHQQQHFDVDVFGADETADRAESFLQKQKRTRNTMGPPSERNAGKVKNVMEDLKLKKQMNQDGAASSNGKKAATASAPARAPQEPSYKTSETPKQKLQGEVKKQMENDPRYPQAEGKYNVNFSMAVLSGIQRGDPNVTGMPIYVRQWLGKKRDGLTNLAELLKKYHRTPYADPTRPAIKEEVKSGLRDQAVLPRGTKGWLQDQVKTFLSDHAPKGIPQAELDGDGRMRVKFVEVLTDRKVSGVWKEEVVPPGWSKAVLAGILQEDATMEKIPRYLRVWLEKRQKATPLSKSEAKEVAPLPAMNMDVDEGEGAGVIVALDEDVIMTPVLDAEAAEGEHDPADENWKMDDEVEWDERRVQLRKAVEIVDNAKRNERYYRSDEQERIPVPEKAKANPNAPASSSEPVAEGREPTPFPRPQGPAAPGPTPPLENYETKEPTPIPVPQASVAAPSEALKKEEPPTPTLLNWRSARAEADATPGSGEKDEEPTPFPHESQTIDAAPSKPLAEMQKEPALELPPMMFTKRKEYADYNNQAGPADEAEDDPATKLLLGNLLKLDLKTYQDMGTLRTEDDYEAMKSRLLDETKVDVEWLRDEVRDFLTYGPPFDDTTNRASTEYVLWGGVLRPQVMVPVKWQKEVLAGILLHDADVAGIPRDIAKWIRIFRVGSHWEDWMEVQYAPVPGGAVEGGQKAVRVEILNRNPYSSSGYANDMCQKEFVQKHKQIEERTPGKMHETIKKYEAFMRDLGEAQSTEDDPTELEFFCWHVRSKTETAHKVIQVPVPNRLYRRGTSKRGDSESRDDVNDDDERPIKRQRGQLQHF